MTGELFNIFIEEPKRLIQFGFKVIKGILSGIVSCKLYILLFGNYQLIDIKNINEWYDFIISGRVAICIVMFYFVNFFLFNILSLLTLFPVHKLVRSVRKQRIDKTIGKFILNLLNRADIIKVNFDTNAVEAGNNIELVENILLEDRNGDNSILDNSLVEDLYTTFSIFALSYVFFFSESVITTSSSILILLTFLVLSYYYFVIRLLVDFLDENDYMLLEVIAALKFRRLTFDFILRKGVLLHDIENEKAIEAGKYFDLRGKSYLLRFFYDTNPIPEPIVREYINNAINKSKKLLLIVSGELTSSVNETIAEYKNSVVIMNFNDEADLTSRLEGFFSPE